MTARWLKPEEAALRLGVSVDALKRKVKAGLIPAPSRHLGERSPRYDREALDSVMLGDQPSASSGGIKSIVARILDQPGRQETPR